MRGYDSHGRADPRIKIFSWQIEEYLVILRRVADRIQAGNKDPALIDIINHLQAEISSLRHFVGLR